MKMPLLQFRVLTKDERKRLALMPLTEEQACIIRRRNVSLLRQIRNGRLNPETHHGCPHCSYTGDYC